MKFKLPRRSFVFTLAAALALFWMGMYQLLRNPNFVSGVKLAQDILADPARLKADTVFLSTVKPSRDYLHAKGMQTAERHIQAELEKAGFEVLRQEVPTKAHMYHNLIARYGDPEAKKIIVVGAHYDVYGEDNPGADDNASGVAGLLELARQFGAHKPKTELPVEFVAYALEEPPFFAGQDMGSAVHAHGLEKEGVEVKYMVSLEMIGYFSDQPWSQDFTFPFLRTLYPSTGNFIAVIGNTQNRRLTRHFRRSMNENSKVHAFSFNAPADVPGVDFSDHRNYWLHGWPALMVTDTAFLRNTEYHKKGDTADRLNFDKMAQVVRGLYAALVQN